MNKKVAGIAFVLLSVLIMSVSAFVYQSATQTVTQTVRRVVSTFVLKNSALGDLFEGESKSYTKATPGMSSLGDAISITTAKANVVLHLDSDINNLGAYYTTYTLTVTYASIPAGSARLAGDTAAALSIANPDTVPVGITLDAPGAWTFDFALTTTAGAVTADTSTTATIVVSAADV